MNSFFISCQKASELIDTKEYAMLPLWQQYQLRIHVSICKTCSRYKQQSEFIEKIVGSSLVFKEETQELHLLPEAVKKNIIEKLKNIKNS